MAIGTPTPVTDEFGINLQGSAMGPASECDLVQVLWATNGIEPPDVYGTPSPNNPPVEGGVSHVGSLTAPDLVDAGLFSVSLFNPRPPNNSRIFVRVFNAPEAARRHVLRRLPGAHRPGQQPAAPRHDAPRPTRSIRGTTTATA